MSRNRCTPGLNVQLNMEFNTSVDERDWTRVNPLRSRLELITSITFKDPKSRFNL